MSIRTLFIVSVAVLGISFLASTAEAQFGKPFGPFPTPMPFPQPPTTIGTPFPGPFPAPMPFPQPPTTIGTPFPSPFPAPMPFPQPPTAGGNWGSQGGFTSPFSGYTYTQFNSATRGQIVIRTDQWGNKTWRPLNGNPGQWFSGF